MQFSIDCGCEDSVEHRFEPRDCRAWRLPRDPRQYAEQLRFRDRAENCFSGAVQRRWARHARPERTQSTSHHPSPPESQRGVCAGILWHGSAPRIPHALGRGCQNHAGSAVARILLTMTSRRVGGRPSSAESPKPSAPLKRVQQSFRLATILSITFELRPVRLESSVEGVRRTSLYDAYS